MFQYRKRYEVTCDMRHSKKKLLLKGFQYRKRYEVTCDNERLNWKKLEAEFQYRKRYEVTCDFHIEKAIEHLEISFNTASGMRSHVTLCLGGRRNRRLKSWFWKTSSKPNMRSHFFGCHYIPSEYVMTPPSLI